MRTITPGERTPASLPEPDAAALAHSRRLQRCIRREIDSSGGCITFARYMHLALYAPGLGYYSAGSRKFGRAGDFVTAPELSPLFSMCVARQCGEVMASGLRNIVEFGAGSGVMARDILRELERRGSLPDIYFILEVSADLRRRQRDTLRQGVPHLLDRVHWLERLPPAGVEGIVLANEVLDAFPVHRFFIGEAGQAGEHYVAWADGHFVWREGPLSDTALERGIDRARRTVGSSALGPGYASEINPALAGWVAGVAEVLARGLVLVIDYGFPRHEYYHPQRRGGTLMCHYRHYAHADPLYLPGLQDITAHVDFTAVAEAAHEAGFAVAGYTSQANFLLGTGVHEMQPPAVRRAPASQLAVAQQIKTLTLPHEMGELFKVIALTRGLDMPLSGFSLRDDRGRL